jgi:dolichyl-phosphate beta-glucosyltransferase
MRLLGHAIQRKRLRHVLGRVFANTASLALGVRVFDTQCGAKLFRVSPRAVELFSAPFLTRWIFDVEIMARLKLARRAAGLPPLSEAMYEFPLDAWRDVAGSTVKGRDFAKAIVEMARIYATYLRPLARYRPPATQPLTYTTEPPSRGDQKAA